MTHFFSIKSLKNVKSLNLKMAVIKGPIEVHVSVSQDVEDEKSLVKLF